MTGVQAMCGRIGMVTGLGLMAVLRKRFPRPLLLMVAAALFGANTINIGADLSAMGDAAELLTGLSSHLWVPLFGTALVWATVRLRYQSVARVLKLLTLALCAYIVTAFYARPDWGEVLSAAASPSVPSGEGWAMVVAILGTTISPYLFFWQASQEVEEEKALGRQTVSQRRGASADEIIDRRMDIAAGTFSSNLIMFFIMLTTALTLHHGGITRPENSRDVAEALRPLAGQFAGLLYTLGLVGTGLLAIPTLSGSAAYALAEVLGWHQGIDERFGRARAFYAAGAVAVALGVAMDFVGLNPIRALYWSAVINGLLAPFLLGAILIVASDRKLMEGQPSPLLGKIVVGITTLAMFGAAVGMFVASRG